MFKWLKGKLGITAISTKVNNLDKKIDKQNKKIQDLEKQVENQGSNVQGLEDTVQRLNGETQRLRDKIQEVENKIPSTVPDDKYRQALIEVRDMLAEYCDNTNVVVVSETEKNYLLMIQNKINKIIEE